MQPAQTEKSFRSRIGSEGVLYSSWLFILNRMRKNGRSAFGLFQTTICISAPPKLFMLRFEAGDYAEHHQQKRQNKQHEFCREAECKQHPRAKGGKNQSAVVDSSAAHHDHPPFCQAFFALSIQYMREVKNGYHGFCSSASCRSCK